MNYITIADLKKQAKKARKNNNEIKNHAESLNFVARQNNYESWTTLIDSSVILKKENTLNKLDRINMLNKFVNDATIQLNELTTMFQITNPDVFSIKAIKLFVKPLEEESETNLLWRARAIKWLDILCFIFVNSDVPKTFKGFRSIICFPELLKVIYSNNLYDEEKVRDLFRMMDYEHHPNHINEPSYEVLEQYGYCSMQCTLNFGYTDILFKFVNLNENITKDHVKNMMISNTALFTRSVQGSSNMLDPHQLFKKYNDSFDSESELKKTLQQDLYP
jgi:hypothetical protein